MSRSRKKTARESILRAAAVYGPGVVAAAARAAAPSPAQQDYVLAQPVPFSPPAYPGPQPAPEAFTVSVQVLSDPHATVAKASFTELGGYTPVYTATGSSRVDNDDTYDPETGTALAVSRALHSLARQLYKKASGRVRHAESNRKANAAKGVRPGGAGTLAEFESVLSESALAGLVTVSGDNPDIVIYMPEGKTEADVPEPVRDLLSGLFPGAAVKVVPDGTAAVPDYAAEAVGSSLADPSTGVRRERPGKHEKGPGDDVLRRGHAPDGDGRGPGRRG